MNWETTIGLEVHAQLKTRSKLFSGSATAYGASPNSQTSFIDAGFPGVLPTLNQEAIRLAIMFGLAVGGDINDCSCFERKNYFYPDLPKGYQISQYQRPIISNGCLEITLKNNLKKNIDIARAHLEEDAGKSLHEAHVAYTGIDLNRAGIPLLEIVTTPCMTSAEEAVTYLKALHELVRFLGICDGNMQEGSFRCDVNISLKQAGSSQLGTRVELKNLNSFRFIEKAILHEEIRQKNLLESNQSVIQETRLYQPDTDTTHPMRGKESEKDYRYFPDPDLLPIQITQEDLRSIQASMPPLPRDIRQNLSSEGMQEADIDFLLSSPALWSFFSEIKNQKLISTKILLNWLKGPYSAALNESGLSFENPPVATTDLANLLKHLEENKISMQQAKNIFNALCAGKSNLDELIQTESQIEEMSQHELEALIHELITNHPQQVADYQAGKEKLLAFFVGQVMKQTKGRANPTQINELLLQYLTKKN